MSETGSVYWSCLLLLLLLFHSHTAPCTISRRGRPVELRLTTGMCSASAAADLVRGTEWLRVPRHPHVTWGKVTRVLYVSAMLFVSMSGNRRCSWERPLSPMVTSAWWCPSPGHAGQKACSTAGSTTSLFDGRQHNRCTAHMTCNKGQAAGRPLHTTDGGW